MRLLHAERVAHVEKAVVKDRRRGKGDIVQLELDTYAFLCGGLQTAVQPAGRFGALEVEGDRVNHFIEKPNGDGRWISGGFFVLEQAVFDYIHSDRDVLELDPMQRLSKDGQLGAYRHHGFWAAMDTLRDKNYLEELWTARRAPWKVWQENIEQPA